MDSVNLFSNLERFATALSEGKEPFFLLFSARWCKASLEGWMWTTQAGTKQKHQKTGRFWKAKKCKNSFFVPDLRPSLQFVFFEVVFGGFFP